MTNPENQLCHRHSTLRAFQQALVGLEIDDQGLTRGNPLAQLENAARLSFAVLELTADADTPEQMLLYRLAVLTQELMTTLFGVDGRRIVRSYVVARAELLALQAETRPDSP